MKKRVHQGRGWWDPGGSIIFFKPRGFLRYKDYSTPVEG